MMSTNNADVKVQLRKLPHGINIDTPFYATQGSAGADLRAAVQGLILIEPGARALIPCGFAMKLPIGYEAQIRPRSGFALRDGVTVLNSPGTIDSDYRGEVKVLLINHGDTTVAIDRGHRIAQMIIAPVSKASFVCVEEFDDNTSSQRGSGGFGSTGDQ